MKRNLLFIFLFFACNFSISTYAQNIIAVEHSGVSTFYQNLDTAMAYAVNGDNVFLPASSYDITSFKLNKGVHLVGAGSNADSSLATGITLFNGILYIISGADNGSVEGIYINGAVKFGTSPGDQAVNMFSINRCNMNDLYLSYSGGNGTSSTNLDINENIIKGNVYCGYAQNTVISKCIIENALNYINGNTTIENNVFLKNTYSEYVITSNSAEILNNIFLTTSQGGNWLLTGTGNTCSNNLFLTSNPIPTGNIVVNSVLNVTTDSLFINQTGNTYNILHNYHLKSICHGKNAGTDGTDIGLYGTATPKKDGEIPYNPHIQSKAIPSSTNSQGGLDVKIKVKAQDN